MTGFNGLAIGLIVFTVDWVHNPTISAAPIVTPYPHRGPWRTPNGVADTKEELSEYLSRFGYLRQRRTNGSIDKELRSAIRNLQRYAGINRTGEIDDATRAVMHKPRCGLPDQPSSSRKRRYTLSGSKWSKTSYYYRFQSFTAKMKPPELMGLFANAFKLWSSVVALTFTQTYNPSLSDFEILFAFGDHGDGFPFDGPGGILAHTFGPTDGRMHFDESEDWNTGMNSGLGIDLRQVAAHEIGHVIGLGHSSVIGALMNPFYPGYNANIRLNNDDIEAIQSLYGIPDNYKPSNEDSPSSSSSSSSSSTTTTTTTTTAPITSSITSPTTTTSTTTMTSLPSSATVVQKLLMTRFTPIPQTKRLTPSKTARS